MTTVSFPLVPQGQLGALPSPKATPSILIKIYRVNERCPCPDGATNRTPRAERIENNAMHTRLLGERDRRGV